MYIEREPFRTKVICLYCGGLLDLGPEKVSLYYYSPSTGYKTDKASGKLTNVISLSQHCVQVKNSGQPIPSLISDPNNR